MVKTIFCSTCNLSVKNNAFSAHLKSILHKNNSSVIESEGIEQVHSALRGRIASYRVRCEDVEERMHVFAPADFLSQLRLRVKLLLSARIEAYTNLKVNFELFSEFFLHKDDSISMKSFATENIILHKSYNFDDMYTNISHKICKKVEEFEERDSGWAYLRSLYLEVNINKYNPLRASGYLDLPNAIKNKRACINIKNSDDYCFLWCVMASLFPAKNNANRTTAYPHFESVLKVKNMTFPVGFTDIRIFEKNNPNISINVYGLKNSSKVVGPLYKCELRKRHHVNMLFLENGKRTHYCLIKDLAKLLRKQLTKHHSKIFLCEDCMIFFDNKLKLEAHVCSGVATILPNQGTRIQFEHYERMQDMPFVLYADFESLLEPVEPNSETSCTTITQKHVPAAFAYYVVCSYDSSLNKYVSYRGPDCVNKFFDNLLSDITVIYNILHSSIPMFLTDKDRTNFAQAKNCYLCNKILFDDKVKDHCHLTGRYRGAAHSYCNIKYCLPKFVPIFFHNLAGYDSHLFIRQLGELSGRIQVIAKNKENYISFTKFFQINNEAIIPVRFVDSFKFLGTSLEKLVANLNTIDFKHLSFFFPSQEHFNLLRRKGVYPYEYVTTWSSYDEEEIPPYKCFFSKLHNCNISIVDYEHAKRVWQTFELRSLGEYTDLYLKSDVLLLADVFESFRKTCKTNYKLDPSFYLTAPSLSFDAMLLKTDVKLELINDLEIIRMIQKGIRGGICLCSTRYSKANNKYLQTYDPAKSDNFLVYIDCNNLYGYAMCAYLPHSNFKLLSELEISKIDFHNIPIDGDIGYILEVDLEYPFHLHNYHNDFPFCAQKFAPPGSKTSKLIPNLYDKFFYVIHFSHLKTCLKHGLLLKKIHRVIQFNQSPYLKQYIDMNTELRKKAKSIFEQDFFKLLNNSIFGKTLEDTEKRVSVKLVNKWNDEKNITKKSFGAEQLIARPNFHSATIFTENFIAVQMKPETITLDKPIYIGFSVLEISKSHMFDFHYSIMKPFYREKLKLCYTDTDSFLYSIESKDFYTDLKLNFLRYFDTSNYPLNNCYGIPGLNKKVPGLFKDELGGNLISEFVGLRSKLYCIKTVQEELKKAKGIQKQVLKNVHFEDYNNVLNKNTFLRKKNIIFKSLKHEIFTQEQNKIALSGNDDKRVILKNKISTMSWGHWDYIF